MALSRSGVATDQAGGGTVLGGSYQKHNWDALPDPNLANRILQRAIRLHPQLVGEGQGIEGLDIIEHRVGLRPVRDGGPRVEADELDGVILVHNYGHGGYGFQTSWGCAESTVSVIEQALKDPSPKGKL